MLAEFKHLPVPIKATEATCPSLKKETVLYCEECPELLFYSKAALERHQRLKQTGQEASPGGGLWECSPYLQA